MPYSNIDDLSERLLVRSQEAILQLDLWIQRQQQWAESDDNHDENDLEKVTDTYNLYMSQLNSLYIRSQNVRDKLNTKKKSRTNTIKYVSPSKVNMNGQSDIEDLIFEFQDITRKLNVLASSRRRCSSSKSSSSRSSSIGSFQPKPLKISLKRNKSLKEQNKKTVTFDVEEVTDLNINSVISLPGSPLRNEQSSPPMNHHLRQAKSYDTGLNSKRSIKPKKSKIDSVYDSTFKNTQRLSISLFDIDTNENDITNISDQETVISSSSLTMDEPLEIIDDQKNNLKPLRRYNSHESILSTKIRPISISKRFQIGPFRSVSTTTTSTNYDTTASNTDVKADDFYKPNLSNSTTSKDILSMYSIKNDVQNSNRGNIINNKKESNSSTSFFNKWNIFNFPLIASSEVGSKQENNTTAKHFGSQRKKQISSLSYNKANYSTMTIGPNGSMFCSPTIYEPTFSNTVSFQELHDALNTELDLA
ncbi:hypothetical protein Kpol_2002p7 [Vanderwaltozyma polyspora DSM 70294]|uniref:Uncharacterized protein n=1 Tax=Vanderwaltozyma polyspora (strain ATCC 22028 / DSM 70294 / BCRC 21397 / CBS 2163 / NBRC 10782 / NRRL Y-8283 / UCD 57-17) TaxID=436907 RepID=A7TFC3_VANPO|nr:uncharacterized protein Kpol_2002p7 [Vanderwaltozyma polyspora DSM 70294]EDO18937.1 hypothetical protein Kpol_2002p7 [Vanderwaltozyma polyspora DSM 70294]